LQSGGAVSFFSSKYDFDDQEKYCKC